MSNLYRSSQEVINKTVDKYVRASAIAFYNPLNGTPYVGVSEEQVERVDGVDKETGNPEDLKDISMSFTADNATTSVNIINPETGETTGTTTYQEIYNTMYSLYFHLAQLRDSDQAAE